MIIENFQKFTSLAISCLAPYVSCLCCFIPVKRTTSSTWLQQKYVVALKITIIGSSSAQCCQAKMMKICKVVFIILKDWSLTINMVLPLQKITSHYSCLFLFGDNSFIWKVTKHFYLFSFIVSNNKCTFRFLLCIICNRMDLFLTLYFNNW